MAFTKHGVLMERDTFIKKCINRGGRATFDIDGGALVVQGAIEAGNSDVYALTFPVTATTRVGVAYNPPVCYDVIADQKFPAATTDDRAYCNVAGDVVPFFFPEVGVEFGIQSANIEGSTAPTVGKFLEVTNTKGTYSIKTTQTADVPSFKVVEILKADYPTGDLSSDTENVYIVETMYNG